VKAKSNRWKEVTMIRVDINDIENKRTIQRINETKSWFFEAIKRWTDDYLN
jgi:hypothetical protein